MKTKIAKEDLVKLYISENKTDKEIAQIFSTSVFCIWQLRNKYGIKGINFKHRKLVDNPHLPITSRQMEIILGSLLGDCCLKNNPVSSYFTISHSIKQKEYVDWLYSELKSICSSAPSQYISKGKYITYWFMSESRKDLKNIRDKIYTPTKKPNQWWLNQISSLGLAVWYMDDGSMTYVNKKKCALSFATNSFTEQENYMLVKMLKDRFDLNAYVKPCNKKSGMQYNIFIADDSFDEFIRIIEPYIVDCMKYKIPGNDNRNHWKDNIECKIDEKTLNRLYNEELFTQEQIARVFGVHKSTIRKYMDLFSICPRDNIEAQIGGRNNRCKRNKEGQFLPLKIEEEQEKMANDIFREIRGQNGFPYISIKSDEYYMGILDRMYNLMPLKDEDGVVENYSRSGMDICSAYCPQIFSMASNGSLSPIQIFNDDDMLMDCIRRTIKYAHKNTITAVRQGLKTYRKNRCVTSFPPMWAKTAIMKCFNQNNLSVLDFSCGFGGRLIGSYCSSMVSKYCGIDPLAENIESHNCINGIIKKHSVLRNINFNAKFIHGMAEDVLPVIEEKFDIVITSPPYFAKERYSTDLSQCYMKYRNYALWKQEWLERVLSMSYSKINDGGYMMIFASNYDKYNVGFDCRDILRSLSGFEPICMSFGLPSLEYLRAKKIKKYDTAWIVQKGKL